SLLIGALRRYHEHLGDGYTVEYPRRSGRQRTLREVSIDLAERLVAIYLPDGQGRRPGFGGIERFQSDPTWRDALLFHEYFEGDDGAGLGASHQTGWPGLVAVLIVQLAEARGAGS